ncbi:hypothetical protein C7D74_32525, partial [Klebsiella pneumoniae]
LWPRLGIRLPGHLPALLGGCAVMLVVNLLGGDALPTINVGDARHRRRLLLGILILWPRLGIRLPGHLPALLGGCAVMLVVNL